MYLKGEFYKQRLKKRVRNVPNTQLNCKFIIENYPCQEYFWILMFQHKVISYSTMINSSSVSGQVPDVLPALQSREPRWHEYLPCSEKTVLAACISITSIWLKSFCIFLIKVMEKQAHNKGYFCNSSCNALELGICIFCIVTYFILRTRMYLVSVRCNADSKKETSFCTVWKFPK